MPPASRMRIFPAWQVSSIRRFTWKARSRQPQWQMATVRPLWAGSAAMRSTSLFSACFMDRACPSLQISPSGVAPHSSLIFRALVTTACSLVSRPFFRRLSSDSSTNRVCIW